MTMMARFAFVLLSVFLCVKVTPALIVRREMIENVEEIMEACRCPPSCAGHIHHCLIGGSCRMCKAPSYGGKREDPALLMASLIRISSGTVDLKNKLSPARWFR